MKKFNINITGNFNIYGEIIPINAFYGKVGDTLYYYCLTSRKQFEEMKEKLPLVNGVLPLPVYVWEGEINGFILKWNYGKLAQTILEYADKNNAWNTGVKKDVLYGMGKSLAEKQNFISDVNRKHKNKYVKDGSKYHANHRHKNKGEIQLNIGECIISRTFNTGRSISYKE